MDEPPIVIVMYGPPCSGKSTLSKIISERYGHKYISPDLIRELSRQTRNLFKGKTNDAIFNEFLNNVKSELKTNKPLVCEGMFISNVRKLKIINICKMTDLKFIYVTASIETLIKRLNNRNNTLPANHYQRRNVLTEERLIYLYNLSKPPKDKLLILHTDKLTIEQSIAQVNLVYKMQFSIQEIEKNVLQ